MERKEMAVYLFLLPALFSSIVAFSETKSLVSQISSQTVGGHRNSDLICELRELKLKIARLELVLEESIKEINTKSLHIKEQEILIDGMSHKIAILQTTLVNIKGDSSHAEERTTTLEEEVRLLWSTSRKNNFGIHILESKVRDTEDKLEIVTSKVEKMADIVTEQWIQIQQLEQALQITEMTTLKAQRKDRSTECTLLKFIEDLSGHHLQNAIEVLDPYFFGEGSTLSSYFSQALYQLKRLLSTAKKYHHELQGFVRQEMKRNEFTAALATNKEVVFFVTSALITFPVMTVWMWLTSQSS